MPVSEMSLQADRTKVVQLWVSLFSAVQAFSRSTLESIEVPLQQRENLVMFQVIKVGYFEHEPFGTILPSATLKTCMTLTNKSTLEHDHQGD